MLEELRIQNFAIIDQLELTFGGGLNVITGETGAGKSIIVDAVELIIGGKPDTGLVRTGAERAVIEGDFALTSASRSQVLSILRREDLLTGENTGFVTLSREVRQNGRSSARINGITVNQEVLREVGDMLVDIHGQSEHLSLFDSRNHIDLLDHFADLLEIREALSTVVHALADVRREIKHLLEDEAALRRRAEQLRRDVAEIDAANLRAGEDDELKSERKRLSNSEQLAEFSAEVVALLSGDDSGINGQKSALDQLMRVAALMNKLAALDDTLKDSAELADGLSAQAQELAIEMAGYGDEIEYDPQRINEIEERLELINSLRRRFGLTIDLVLEHREKAQKELDGIEHSEERLSQLREKETLMLKQIGELAASISDVRGKIGRQLSKRVVQELQDLRMERTQFEVSITHTPEADGCYVGDQRLAFSETGIDTIEFMLSANPGEPLRPLAKIASGGEAARIMLALKRVLTEADHTPTLIFDEVDQGIGGRVGSVVGQKLWELSEKHQVLVVTHLPQLAGYADKHFRVHKQVSGGRTMTQVVELAGAAPRIDELSAMIGATGEGSKQSAHEILEEARSYKGQRV